jgi:hypothetical protein
MAELDLMQQVHSRLHASKPCISAHEEGTGVVDRSKSAKEHNLRVTACALSGSLSVIYSYFELCSDAVTPERAHIELPRANGKRLSNPNQG